MKKDPLAELPEIIRLINQHRFELAKIYIATHSFEEIMQKCADTNQDVCDLLLEKLELDLQFHKGRIQKEEILALIQTLIIYHPKIIELIRDSKIYNIHSEEKKFMMVMFYIQS